MEAVKEITNHSAQAPEARAAIEALKRNALPLRWVSFHAAIGLPGAIEDATTFNYDKHPGIKLWYHPNSQLIIAERKGRTIVTHATSAKGMEFDFEK